MKKPCPFLFLRLVPLRPDRWHRVRRDLPQLQRRTLSETDVTFRN